MNLCNIMIYIIIGICTFFMSGYIGSKFGEYEKISSFELKENFQSFNFIYRILFPVIFVFIFINILEYIGIQCKNYWIAVSFYWIFRSAFIIIMGRISLTNKVYFFTTLIISNICGIIVYNVSIKDHQFLLPGKDNLVSQFWIIVLLFLYKLFGEMHSYYEINEKRKNRLKKYTIAKLYNFYPKYISIIKEMTGNSDIIKVIFSIMIVEDFNRPRIIRYFENKFPNFFKTKGIMQVTATGKITNDKSVEIASNVIITIYNQVIGDTDKGINYMTLDEIAKKYNGNSDYPMMVREVYYAIEDDKIFNENRGNAKCSNGKSDRY